MALRLVTALFYGAQRIRARAEPVVVVLATVGAMSLYHWWATRRRSAAVAPAIAATGHDDRRALAGGRHD